MFRRTRIGLVLLAGVVVGGLAWRVTLSQDTEADADLGQTLSEGQALVAHRPLRAKNVAAQPVSGGRQAPAPATLDDDATEDTPFGAPTRTLGAPALDTGLEDELSPQPAAPPTSADLRQRLIYLTTKRSVRMSNEELDAAIKELSEQLDAQDQQAEAELQQVIERLQEIVKSFPGTPAAARAENALNAVKNPPTSDDFGGNDAIRPKQRM